MARTREVATLNFNGPLHGLDGWIAEDGRRPVTDDRGRLLEPFVITHRDQDGDVIKRERFGIGVTLPTTPEQLEVHARIVVPLDHKGNETAPTETWFLWGVPMVGRVPTPFYLASTVGTAGSTGGHVMATATKQKSKPKAAQKSAGDKDELARKAKVRNRAWKRARAISNAEKEKFVKAWDAGKVDWQALEKQFAEEDRNKGKPKTTVKVTPKAKTTKATVKAPQRPKAEASAEQPNPTSQPPATEAKPPTLVDVKTNRQGKVIATKPAPFTKEMQVGRKRPTTRAGRQSIQKRMASQNGDQVRHHIEGTPAPLPEAAVVGGEEQE
jgi:hypothetical protein